MMPRSDRPGGLSYSAMLEFIELALSQVQGALMQATPALLESLNLAPFTAVDRVFVGQAPNPPQCWVMPVRTVFADEGSNVEEASSLVVTAAVSGGDPEALGAAAISYVWAIDEAIRQWAAWDARVMRVFIQEHDYGKLYAKGGAFTRFPDVHVLVEMQEVWQ